MGKRVLAETIVSSWTARFLLTSAKRTALSSSGLADAQTQRTCSGTGVILARKIDLPCHTVALV